MHKLNYFPACMWSRNCLSFRSTCVHLRMLVGLVLHNCLVFFVVFCKSLYVLLSFCLVHCIVWPFVLMLGSLYCMSFCPFVWSIVLYVLLSICLVHCIVCASIYASDYHFGIFILSLQFHYKVKTSPHSSLLELYYFYVN